VPPLHTTRIERGCERCGTCCRQGGPALHLEDLPLLQSGKIPLSRLITIRKGEWVHTPFSATAQPARVELVKIAGSRGQWSCGYYDQTLGCTIYEHRPLACRVLKCWATEEILALVEKDTLSRRDILPADHFLLPAMAEHERLCPSDDLHRLGEAGRDICETLKRELLDRVRREMAFRLQLVERFHLQLGDELFYFGRPFFQLLQLLGVRVSESPDGLRLHWENFRLEVPR